MTSAWVETVVRTKDEYYKALEDQNSILDPRLPPDMEDRIFDRSTKGIGEVREVLKQLPRKCQNCFWAGIDREDIE